MNINILSGKRENQPAFIPLTTDEILTLEPGHLIVVMNKPSKFPIELDENYNRIKYPDEKDEGEYGSWWVTTNIPGKAGLLRTDMPEYGLHFSETEDLDWFVYLNAEVFDLGVSPVRDY